MFYRLGRPREYNLPAIDRALRFVSILAGIKSEVRCDSALQAVQAYTKEIIDDPSLIIAMDQGSSLRAARYDAGTA